MPDIEVKVLRTVRIAVPGTVYGREIVKDTVDQVPSEMVIDLYEAGYIAEPDGGALRGDGPTVAEYVAAGYLASQYPPSGYASRSTTEEIAAAVAEEVAKAGDTDLDKMTRAELEAFAAAKGIDISSAKNKGEAVDLIRAAVSASI